MNGILNIREAYARMQSQRMAQPTETMMTPADLVGLSYLGIVIGQTSEPPVLQNTNGTFVAQPLYDR